MSNEKILNIYESLAQEVSKDVDSAKIFLEEEGIESESSFQEKLSPIINKIRLFLINDGKANQEYLQAKYRKFSEEIKGLQGAKVIELYPPLAKTGFRELSVKEISQRDIQNLLQDASFLTFLESYSDDDPR